jgi:hypothetical protein
MSDIVIAIWVIAFLVALLGCIPYGIWMIYTAVKKRWKRLTLQVAVPLSAFLVLMGISWIVNELAHERYLEGLCDTKVDLGRPIFEYDSERAFNGDGYSISVYELPSSIRARFEAADDRLLSDFPKHPSYRDHWSFERWRRSPFDEKFQKYLDFALSSYDSDRASGLSEQFESIRNALSGDGAYYAFFYYSHGDYPGDIDLFIVDLKGNRLYFINHNT